MKPVRVIILLILLLAQTVLQAGIPVFFHYCDGDLETISFFEKGSGCCGDEEATDMDCCSTDLSIIQQHSDFTSHSEKASLDLTGVPLIIIQWFQSTISSESNLVVPVIDTSPETVQSKQIKTFLLRI